MVRTAGRSAPYGQACLSCFKTKCKCIPRLEGNGCERCHRLKRPCHPADVARRRSDKKQNSSDDRIAKLEGTLGQLVSLLQAGNTAVGIINSPGDVGGVANMDSMGNMGGGLHDDRVHAWSQQQQQQQQQQQKSPSPQQHLHHHHHHHQQQHQPQQEQQPQSQSQSQPQPMLGVEAAEHPATLMMHTPPSVTYPDVQDVAASRTGRDGAMEDSRAIFNDEEDDADPDANGAPAAAWWAMENANGFGAHSIPLATPAPTVSHSFMSPAVSPPSASISLDRFRSQMLHHFPFVHLPAHLAAEQLGAERPFLFRAITYVTLASAKDKRESSLELKRVLCDVAFLQMSPHREQQQPEQTVDLLLGLLVYLAWGWEHLVSRRSLCRLMAAATSLAGELRSFDQTTPEITRTICHLEPKSGFDDVVYSSTTTTAATSPGGGVTNAQLYLERQRAILGCFALGSAVSAYCSQVDAPRWSHHMDEGLVAITASGRSAGSECPSDAALAIQVRLHLLVMKASQVREHAQLPDHPLPEKLTPQSLSYIKALMAQLQEIRNTVPPACQQQFVLLAQTYYTEMCIVHSLHIPQAKPEPPPCGPTRPSCFWQSALAIKSCTSTFLTLSPAGLLGVSFIQWSQLARCVATLHQLSAHYEPGWDPAAVRNLVDLPALLSCTVDKLELAAAEAGEEPASADGVFTQLARGLRMYKSTYHERELLAQQDEARRIAEARDGLGARSDPSAEAATVTGANPDANQDALIYGQEAGFLASPTSWLDQFFVDFKD